MEKEHFLYQEVSNDKLFILPEQNLIIDFNQKKIGTMGVAGISTHIPKSKRMVVLLAPHKKVNYLGVLLGDKSKTNTKKPIFVKSSVSYKWN